MSDEVIIINSPPDPKEATRPRIQVKPLHTLTATQQRNKSRHANVRQREKMVEIIMKNPEVFRGRKGVRALDIWKNAWKDLTQTLNRMGPPRSLSLWHKTWMNMIRKAREKQTTSIDELTEMDLKILTFFKMKGDTFLRQLTNRNVYPSQPDQSDNRVLKTYPGRVKPTTSTSSDISEQNKEAEEDDSNSDVEVVDSITNWISSPDANECPEMQINLLRTYGSCTRPIENVELPQDNHPEEDHLMEIRETTEEHPDTENSSVQSPQPSTSHPLVEIEDISDTETFNASPKKNQESQTENGDQSLLLENERLKAENDSLRNQVNFMQQEFSKMTDILYSVTSVNSKK